MLEIDSRETLVESNFDSMVEFTAAGHRDTAPVYVKDEKTGLLGVYGGHGFYRQGVHADGRQAVLFSVDPHDLDPVQHADRKFREKYAPGYYLDLNKVKNIRVAAARRGRSFKQWVNDAVSHHNYRQSELKSEYGYLYRVTNRLWLSGAVAYTLDAADPKDVPGSLKNDDGTLKEPLYLLRCYTTAGRDYPFTDLNEKIQKNRIGTLLSVGANSVFVSMKDAETAIRDDFSKRVTLVMQGKDPGLLGRGRDAAMQSLLSPHITGLFNKAADTVEHATARAIQATFREVRNLKAKVIVMGITKTALLSALQFVFKGWHASVGQILITLARPVMEAARRAEDSMKRSGDIARTFAPMSKKMRDNGIYDDRLDPAQAPLIRLLGIDESRTLPLGAAVIPAGLPADWADNYLLDTLNSPPGSIMTRKRMGRMDVLHVIQPDGMELHYLVGSNVAYARLRPEAKLDRADPAPEAVAKLMRENNFLVKVTESAEGKINHTAFDSHAAFLRDMREESCAAPVDAIVAPLQYDLGALNAVSARIAPKRQTLTGRAVRASFNAAARAGRALKIVKSPAPGEPLTSIMARTLETRLANRGPVGAGTEAVIMPDRENVEMANKDEITAVRSAELPADPERSASSTAPASPAP